MEQHIVFGERSERQTVEDGLSFAPKFGPDGLIPVVTQDALSGAVLMVAYMNEEALARTLESGEAVYYSRSRDCLWHKGATSGHVQRVQEVRTDCDQDVVLLKVEQVGPGCCHAGYASCFYRRVPTGDGLVASTNAEGVLQMEQAEERSYNPEEVYN